MDFLIKEDIESVLEITGNTMEELAEKIGVTRLTISNWLNNKASISDKHIDAFYSYVYKTGIKLNKIKEQFYREDVVKNREILLFHGAKSVIEGELSTNHNKKINDFGHGFYCGENLEQSVMFVAARSDSSLYMLKFDSSNLICKTFNVDTNWILTIAYYRGLLNEYSENKLIKEIAKTKENIDYIIAPIADNRMFEIIDTFIDGEITDVQCQHSLSATNLGMQYIFVSERSLKNVELLERCYLTTQEKNDYLNSRQESFKINMDKVKLAKRQYRNKGQYIEDILK